MPTSPSNSSAPQRVAVVGGGPMGLACAYELLSQGCEVTIFERDSVWGGMTASFDFDGIQIERFYHFICTSDEPFFKLLKELGIHDTLRWTRTRMGYFHGGELQDWGEPFALLKFKGLGLIGKIRYGLMALAATRRKRWDDLDHVNALKWLKGWIGDRAYDVLWRQLFELKFYHFTDNLSAAWIWSRMRRMGTSRESLLHERLGYLAGGSEVFLRAITEKMMQLGGNLRLSAEVERIAIKDGLAEGVVVNGELEHFDQVISTVPLPFVADMLTDLPPEQVAPYAQVDNIAVVCVLVKMRQAFSPYFWLNISDPAVHIPGVIEYTNLCPLDDHVLYVPFYMPAEHPDYQRDNVWFEDKVRQYLRTIRPDFSADDLMLVKAGRYRYAQPICPPGFLATLPDIQVLPNLRVADTSYYYPEDRSISESVQLGRKLAEDIS